MILQIDLDSICRKYDITQAELSERTKIKQPNLSRIKRNRSISLKNLSKIAVALNEKDIARLISVSFEDADS
ncbi:helix-turn-helix transcriptional regulator [Bacillus pacificus]|uniref:helix-turn-helix domain-containing protein n=1 Tax=Bacillus cereus group TaxID=86661 RepID=UPI001E41D038|nr:helix-turn-helix transcriptional regulator [Bacillus pacificus]MCC2485007.1 helix-turn-helix transcriptional regulator [Bacillus pacificus]HDR7611154.1 helix-turn-helix transcriptional regulator [Bacillus mycoides]